MQDIEVMRLRSRLHKAGFKEISICVYSYRPLIYNVYCKYNGETFSSTIPYSELRFHPQKIVRYIL